MNQKQYIIIALVAIIAVLSIGIGYALLTQSNIEYERVNISNGTTIEVPKAQDAEWTKDPSGIKTYTCNSKHIVMNSFNSEEDLTLVGAGAYALERDLLLDGAKDVETYKNYQIKENDINGTHYYIVNIANNSTHDNIIIGGNDLNIIKHMLDSLVFGPPAKQANATVEDSQPAQTPSNNNDNNNNDKKYSEDDLRKASEEGYDSGYADGYDDSFDDYYDDYDYDYEDYDDYDYSDSGESDSGNIETTTEDSR